MIAPVLLAVALAALLPGSYSNEEQVYFQKGAGKAVPPWQGLVVTATATGYRLQPVDAYGVKTGPERYLKARLNGDRVVLSDADCSREYARAPAGLTLVNHRGRCAAPGLTAITDTGLAVTLADGTAIELRRGRQFRCWASIPRRALKDGKADWWFKNNLLLHDAGGRVAVVTDEAEPQRFSLRMRNIVWPSGPNQPSLVLYVHGDDPEQAIGYGWADPLAQRLGINLRSIQASCSLARDAPAR